MYEYEAMQIKVFKLDDYRETEDFEKAVNMFLGYLQKKKVQNQLSAHPEIVYILYKTTLHDGGDM